MNKAAPTESDLLARLREDINVALRELDAGLGAELDIEDVITEARSRRSIETSAEDR